jgi:AcrR family transcriptional regulator
LPTPARDQLRRGQGETGSETLDGLGDGPTQVASVQRARLIAAMTGAAAHRGAADVTVADVMERAGMSRRTFYELFDDLDDCLLAAFEDALAGARERVGSVYDQRAPWPARVRAALAELLVFFEERPEHARMLLIESLTAGMGVVERRAQVLAELAAALDEDGRRAARAQRTPSVLAGEGAVGGVASILHERVRAGGDSLVGLCSPLMALIVLPYLGPVAARREIELPAPERAAPLRTRRAAAAGNPFADLPMRLTYRTIRVLHAIAASPGASNRHIGEVAGIVDQGQTSKLLARLLRLGLVGNEKTDSHGLNTPNMWTLSERGEEILGVLDGGLDRGRPAREER